jgi:hypothetical protein
LTGAGSGEWHECMRKVVTLAALILGTSLAYAGATKLRPPADASLRYVAPSPVVDGKAMQLAKRLEELAKEKARVETEIARTAWPFPEPLTPNDHPAVLLPKLVQAAAKYGDQIAFHTVDCSEYPCIFMGVAGKDNPVDFWKKVPDAAEKSRTTTVVHKRIGDCGAFLAVASTGGPHYDVVGKRIDARIDAVMPKSCNELYFKP